MPLSSDESPATGLASAPKRGSRVHIQTVRQVFPGGVVALDGISLDVPAGQFFSILGPSGCGKSTLLRLIAGLDKPAAGLVSVTPPARHDDATRATTVLPYHAIEPADVAYVFQDAHLLPWRTVRANVELPLEFTGVARQRRADAAAEALERVGLADAMSRYPAQLSGGMRMRVSLARALVTNPSLLLMDEPFAALDEITRQRLDEQLRDLWRSMGMTVIFVTHSIPEAVFLAERVMVFTSRPGRILADRSIDLPIQRDAVLRGSPAFAAQTADLFAVLSNG